jgi:heptosyltransferase-3
VRLRSLGDVVLTTPAFDVLHVWRPDLRLVVAVEPVFTPVLEDNPSVAEIFPIRRFLPAAARLAARRFPVALNLHGGPTSALLVAATLAPVRVAWERSQFRSLANVLVPGPKAFFGDRGVHTAEHRMTPFWRIGLPRGPVGPARVFAQKDALASVEKLLAARGLEPGRPYVVVQPGGASATGRWALENFARVAEWLAAEYHLAPLLLLGPRERVLSAGAKAIFPAPAVVLEGLDLRQVVALISRARLYVGNDTGPTHVAAAAGCPVVDIFGSTSDVHWRPWQTPSRVVLNEFACRPCRGGRCHVFDEPRCILSVKVEQVKQACRELLAETAAEGA